MNSIEIVYNELKELKENITLLRGKKKEFNERFVQLLAEVRDTEFNAIEGVELYKSMQEFLQERRLLSSRVDELEIQYDLLGGDKALEKYNQMLDFQNVKTNPEFKKTNKYYRNKKYFKNFPEKYKKEIDKMYHIC